MILHIPEHFTCSQTILPFLWKIFMYSSLKMSMSQGEIHMLYFEYIYHLRYKSGITLYYKNMMKSVVMWSLLTYSSQLMKWIKNFCQDISTTMQHIFFYNSSFNYWLDVLAMSLHKIVMFHWSLETFDRHQVQNDLSHTLKYKWNLWFRNMDIEMWK